MKSQKTISFIYNLGVNTLGLPQTITHTFKSWDY